jgi:hypothetical protein
MKVGEVVTVAWNDPFAERPHAVGLIAVPPGQRRGIGADWMPAGVAVEVVVEDAVMDRLDG